MEITKHLTLPFYQEVIMTLAPADEEKLYFIKQFQLINVEGIIVMEYHTFTTTSKIALPKNHWWM